MAESCAGTALATMLQVCHKACDESTEDSGAALPGPMQEGAERSGAALSSTGQGKGSQAQGVGG